jgi:hypothetical protein
MKNALALILSMILMVTIISCKKENNAANPNPSNAPGNLVRIQQGTDPDITNDTVYLISYVDSSHISSIVDSVNQDTFLITTTATGDPLTVKETYGFAASYTYDGSGVIQQIDYNMAGSHEQDVFEYSNGVLSKRTHKSNLGAGPVSIQGSFTYVVTGGNITYVKEYDLNGTFVQETTCTYGAKINNLKTLGLLNLGNILGADTFLNIETGFNKNLVEAYSSSGMGVSTVYTLNTGEQPAHVVSTDNINNYIFTWNFSYK